MLRDYFGALIDTTLLISIAGSFSIAAIWLVLSYIHAPHAVLVGGEIIGLMGVAILAGFVFRMTLGVERELRETGT